MWPFYHRRCWISNLDSRGWLLNFRLWLRSLFSLCWAFLCCCPSLNYFLFAWWTFVFDNYVLVELADLSIKWGFMPVFWCWISMDDARPVFLRGKSKCQGKNYVCLLLDSALKISAIHKSILMMACICKIRMLARKTIIHWRQVGFDRCIFE